MSTHTATDTFQARVESVEDGVAVLVVPDTSYRLHLEGCESLASRVGQRVRGRVTAQAKRVDVVGSGGRFVEPVFGRPRRVQGRVITHNPSANTLTVRCGVVVTAKLMPAQNAADIPDGAFVAFDVERGASFERAG